MPGPVSDAYDPEFGTGNDAQAVRDAIQAVVNEISGRIGMRLEPILGIVRGGPGGLSPVRFSDREIRIIRFGLARALESL